MIVKLQFTDPESSCKEKGFKEGIMDLLRKRNRIYFVGELGMGRDGSGKDRFRGRDEGRLCQERQLEFGGTRGVIWELLL